MPSSRGSSSRGSPAKDREIPAHGELVEYNYAVAGHAGTMCDAEGELFIKPCTQAEVDFYQEAASEHPDFAEIMPTYIGMLTLTETTDEAQIHAQIPDLVERADIPAHLKEEIQSHLHLDERPVIPAEPLGAEPATKKHKATNEEAVDVSKRGAVDPAKWVPTRKLTTDRAVVLDNASFGFKRPNILDAKLGLRLWADNAPQQKKDRFDKIAAETTHKNFGFRVAGMRVYKGATNDAELDKEGYRIYDKDWGRLTVNDDNLLDSLKKFVFNARAGLDEELGKILAGRFARDLRHVQEVLENEESRMFSASLLFVCEGDGDALREALVAEKEFREAAAEREAQAKASMELALHERGGTRTACSNLRVDSGIGISEEDLSNGETVITVDLDDDDFDDEEADLPDIHALKLIDFAHAEFKPGHGPDENVLKGVRSLAKLFEDMSQ